MKKRSNLKILLKILLSLAFVIYLAFSVDVEVLKSIQPHVDALLIAEIILVLFLSLFVRAFRWWLLMNSNQPGLNVGLGTSFKLLFIGNFLNLFVPAGSGDIIKSYWGYKITGQKERMFAVSLYDKIIGIASVSMLAVFAFYLYGNSIYLLAALVSLGPWAVLLLLFLGRETAFIRGRLDWVDNLQSKFSFKSLVGHLNFKGRDVLTSFVISVIGWVLTYLLLFLILSVVIENVRLQETLSSGSLLTLGRLFPFTLNGIGSDEFIMVEVFKQFNYNETFVFAGSLLYRIAISIIPALIGFVIVQGVKS